MIEIPDVMKILPYFDVVVAMLTSPELAVLAMYVDDEIDRRTAAKYVA